VGVAAEEMQDADDVVDVVVEVESDPRTTAPSGASIQSVM